MPHIDARIDTISNIDIKYYNIIIIIGHIERDHRQTTWLILRKTRSQKNPFPIIRKLELSKQKNNFNVLKKWKTIDVNDLLAMNQEIAIAIASRVYGTVYYYYTTYCTMYSVHS